MTPLRRFILLVSLVPLLLVLAGGSMSLAQNDVPLFRHEQPPRRFVCVSIPYHGNLELAIVTDPAIGPFGRVVEREAGYVVLTKQWQPIAGFYAGPVALGGFGVGGPRRAFIVVIPFWLLLSIAAALPTAVAWPPIRQRRRLARLQRLRLCTVCGYDLRSSPGRCPECGTVIPVSATL
jgi:hypothetical protein